MVMQSRVEQVIQESIFRDRKDQETGWLAEIERALDFYYGYQVKAKDGTWYMPKFEGEAEPQWKDRQTRLVICNITRMIAEKYGKAIYKNPVQRSVTIDGDETGLKKPAEYDELVKVWESSEYAKRMIHANIMRYLLGDYWIRPYWDDKRKQVRLVHFTPDQVKIWQDEVDNPENYNAVIVEYSSNQNTTKVDNVKWVFFEDSCAKYLDGKIVKGSEAKQDDLGWIQLKYDIVPGEPRGRSRGFELVEANLQINQILSGINWLSFTQAHGQPVFINVDKDSFKGGFGPTSPQFLRQFGEYPPDFKYVVSGADINGAISWAERYIGVIFASFGLSNKNPIRLDASNPESGIAKWIEESTIMDDQKPEAAMMAEYEEDIAIRIMKVAAEAKGKQSDELKNDKVSVAIEFQEPQRPLDAADQMNLDSWMIDMGLISKATLIRRMRPDIKTNEDAIRELVRVAIESEDIEIERLKQVSAIKPPQPQQNRFLNEEE